MREYKILFLLIFALVVFVFLRDSENFANLSKNQQKDNIRDIGCKPRECKCKNCQWFDYNKKQEDPKPINTLYMKNNRNILISDSGAILWEDDNKPEFYYTRKFKKINCPDKNRTYFQKEDTCWNNRQ